MENLRLVKNYKHNLTKVKTNEALILQKVDD